MTQSVSVLDRPTRVAPLGIRFWDPVCRNCVRDGLEVVLYPLASPQLKVLAQANPSGVYVLHDGPGLGRAALGVGDVDYWRHPPQEAAYRCEVRDAWSRYHPVAFDVRLPFKGLYRPGCAEPSPPGSAPGVELFSTAARAAPAAMAVVRAELVSALTGDPAAWAMLTVAYAGQILGRGLADQLGRVAAMFPYPEPERRPRRSPPESVSPPQQPSVLMTWEVEVSANYSPALAASSMPDLCQVLAQPQARMLASRSPSEELLQATVALGRDSYLGPEGQSRVWVAADSMLIA